MNYFYKRVQKFREKNLDSLAKLYEYSTTIFEKNSYTKWADSKEVGYSFGQFSETCDGL